MFRFPDPTAAPIPFPRPAPARRATPEGVLAELVAGNQRFVAGAARHGHRLAAALAAAADPRPYAAVVGCMDSRVPVEAVFDQDFGAVCAIRTAGHALDQAAVASARLAVDMLGVTLVLVLGHTRCAAIAAAMEPRRPGAGANAVLDEIDRNIGTVDFARTDAARIATRAHVVATARRLRMSVAATVAGAVYDVDTGRVEVLSTL
ncbi:carbonic anhydrase [Phytohabitans rumicis]|uniref:carbonic anhydrase n=1 Tax=Phytohabitans rumicis TaxID=1076125 RepID=A0A6V8LL06_9ACTN|nr:carbonic anhydrase [Phytohabitans rumicis]GFJ95319.1 hypothetical protein Prum_089610 [Phytohabitans rumicis]